MLLFPYNILIPISDFRPKSRDLGAANIYFSPKHRDLGAANIYFSPKHRDLGAENIYFRPKYLMRPISLSCSPTHIHTQLIIRTPTYKLKCVFKYLMRPISLSHSPTHIHLFCKSHTWGQNHIETGQTVDNGFSWGQNHIETGQTVDNGFSYQFTTRKQSKTVAHVSIILQAAVLIFLFRASLAQ